jgi:acyl transferase domain-containing protein/acyl-CoA synthetase (AMP-forming)/AMP-acid ligase II/acyl carrier protein
MNDLATLHALFAPVPWINDFRVVQESDARFTVHCVTDEDCCIDDLRALLNESAPNLAARVEPRIVPELSPTVAAPDGAAKDGVPAIRDAAAVPGLAELPRTLPETLRRAAQNAQAGAIVHLAPDGAEKRQSFADLLAEAEAVCGGLLRFGLKAGDSALLLLDDSAEVLPAFWGCLLAGIKPAIAPIPPTFSGENRGLDQLCHVWRLLDGPLVITSAELIESVQTLSARLGVEQLRCAEIASLMSSPPANEVWSGQPGETAFFCLTSGSTGVPKCIMLTHANIIQRAHGANVLCGHSAQDVILNWLPFDHIGSISDWHLRCVLLGCRMVYAGKGTVITRPLNWLDLIDKYRVTDTWAPNFAYSLVCNALTALRADQKSPPNWDLSCVNGMLTAGESVSPMVIQPFLAELAPFGLLPTAIRPAFGMAELGSGITYRVATKDRPLKFHSVARQMAPGRPNAASPDAANASTFTSLGPPIPGVGIRIVNEEQQVVLENVVGNLQVRGTAVSPGYYRNPEANCVFRADGWFDSGDMGFLSEGELVITGRAKESIIIRGVNYACSEIEEAVNSVPGVEPSFTAACAVQRAGAGREELAVFFHTAADEDRRRAEILREVQQYLVRQMGVRADFLLPVPKETIPKTAIGKLQRGELSRRFAEGQFNAVLASVAELQRGHDGSREAQIPNGEIEKQVAAIWKEVLGLEQIGVQDNLFDLGGDSLLLTGMHIKLQQQFGPRITLVEMFNYPTIQALAKFISRSSGGNVGGRTSEHQTRRKQRDLGRNVTPAANDVAVIGMACRFPGAGDLNQFWRNLCAGVESTQFFSEEEVLAAGVDPKLVRDPNYVKVSAVLPDIEWFDARFFGITPRDAVLMDPQQRVLLECAWEAFEVAGYNPQTHPGSVGVYAGAVMNTYLLNNLLPARSFQSPGDASEILTLDSWGGFRVMITNDKDYLPTRISYKLNLRGPSVNVQTACSTTLVAIHMAAEAVLNGECDMALAGGVSIKVPQEAGYLFLDDMIVSPDGHCRAFDARAQGTIFGNGAGMVLLKRLDEAIEDGDHIFAVIKGSAINNDGSGKVGYLAPSQEGVAAVVSDALERSGVDPRTIGFVEAHGTGTALGDPIELGAMAQAFRAGTSETAFCAVGSVKTNVGHLQIASGVAGFIKAALALYHRQIPATLHFENPNPRIDFENSPFFVNTSLQEWSRAEQPLRAGVNSMGIGGTNAHVVLEEAPAQQRSTGAPPRQHLLPISARTPTALRALIGRYRDALEQFDDASLPNVCFTAAVGRVHFGERFTAIGSTIAELKSALVTALSQSESDSGAAARRTGRTRIGFLFSGLGPQYVGMARELYETQPRFRETLDRCSELLASELPQPLLDVLYGPVADSAVFEQAVFAEPALFAIEFALAEMWRDWGVEPCAVLGHGLGEYVAACVAGVFSLEDALRLVCARARLKHELPHDGGMLAVRMEEERVRELLPEFPGLSIVAVNGPRHVVVSGEPAVLSRLLQELKGRRIAARKLPVSHQFPSPITEELLAGFRQVVEEVALSPPKILLLSNVTGHPLGTEIANAEYWCRQLVEPVRFADGVRTLAEACDRFLEIGPHPVLLPLARRILRDDPRFESDECWLRSLRKGVEDWTQILDTLAELYVAGLDVNWESFHRDVRPRRVVLPTYPFERKRFWVDRPPAPAAQPKTPHGDAHRSSPPKATQSHSGRRHALKPQP